MVQKFIKIEKWMLFIFLSTILIKYTEIFGGNILFYLTGIILSTFYLFFAMPLLKTLQLKGHKIYFNKVLLLTISVSISLSFSVAILSLVFLALKWNGFTQLYIISIIFLIANFILVKLFINLNEMGKVLVSRIICYIFLINIIFIINVYNLGIGNVR